jgi:hypothetical protein
MEVSQLEKLVREITGNILEIYLPEDPNCKYSNYTRVNGELNPSTKYGVKVNRDSYIEYNFTTSKNPETFIKTFITQYISKYEMKQGTTEFIDGKVVFVYPKKAEVINRLTTDRVTKYHYYTTLYGIGIFSLFTANIAKATEKLAEHLKKQGVEYHNEHSDAHWVYRFVISKGVETHNNILNNFNI